MPKMKDLRNEGLYSTRDIVEKAKKIYKIDFNYDDDAMQRQVQRYFGKKHNKSEKNKSKGKGRYYSTEQVDALLSDEKYIEYFQKISDKKNKHRHRSNEELILEQKAELNNKKEELFKLWEKAGLTDEEGNYLEFDKFNQRKYLQADELVFLNRKGMTLREDLSDEEKEMLIMFERLQQEDEFETKKVEEIFTQKKLEMMITALFNKQFTLDEEMLHNDINNWVRGGEYSSNTYILNGEAPSQEVRRSFLRLQNINNYVAEKKK